MTIRQVSQVRRWLLLHGRGHPVELQALDLVLILWMLGWAGLPSLMVIGFWPILPLCLAAALLPSAYAWLRRRLHRRGWLRCDWLTAL